MDFLKRYLNDEYLWSNTMLEMIMAFFKGAKFAKLSSAMAVLSPLLQHLEENYAADKDARA